jgi:type IV secretory pathway VirJ component
MTQPSTSRSGKTRLAKRLGLLLLAVLLGCAVVYCHAGYYNGPLFRDLPAARPDPARPAVVLLSGDMGNRIGMTPKIAARLNRRGYAVVTVNSLTYFSPRRTAREAATLIETAMARAMSLGKTNHVVVIGQSFGADMLHAGLAQFSTAARQPIRAVVLVVPGEDIIFRASPIELAGLEIPDQLALPTASRLTWAPVTCIHGAVERESLCPLLAMPNVRRITLPGGHKLNSDDSALAAAIFSAIERAGQARSE